jgi:hypothetical protein
VRRNASEDLDEPERAGVHHARLAQERQLLPRQGERLVARSDNLGESVPDRQLEAFGPLRDGARDGEDRPFLGLEYRCVTGVARSAERHGERPRIDLRRDCERLGRAAQELRQDHARITPRAHERRTRHLVNQLLLGRRGGASESIGDGAHRQRHVRARVPVGNGVDVQVVDSPAARLEGGERGVCEATKR